MSGLGVNLLKSTLFLDGGDTSVLHNMASTYGLAQGTLPVKYLGVPLIPNKMKASDFQPLIENIRAKFTSWTSRQLSFAGRLQLLHSVISSVINFWASIFLLPSKCLTLIEQLCNAFLWSGSTLSGKKAKVSWDAVCTPKKSGGLGLRRLSKWNTVLCLKLIWMLFTNSGSLWVSWVRSHILGTCSLWETPHPNPSASWMWNRILKLRQLARSFIHCNVGSGTSCSFWHDSWSSLGPLASLLGLSAISITGISTDATVQDAIIGSEWRLSNRSRNPTIVFLRENLPSASSLLRPHTPDCYFWSYPGDPITVTPPRFSASKTFCAINPPPPPVSWYKRIWFSGRIPKHAFITWLAIRDRLATRHRISRYLPLSSTSCLLCTSHIETREHLFFSCPYSFSLLSQVLRFTLVQSDLMQVIQWLPRASPSPILITIAHLLIQATVYSIWRERNSRLHTASNRPVSQLLHDIDLIIKAKLAALSQSNPPQSPTLLEHWFGLTLGYPTFQFRS